MDVNTVLSSLSAEIRIVGRGELPFAPTAPLPPGVHAVGDTLVCPVGDRFLVCPKETPGGEDLLRLAAALLDPGETREHAWLRLLKSADAEGEAENWADLLQAGDDMPRTVVLIAWPREEARDDLADILPLAETDVLLRDGSCTVLIKDMSDLPKAEDVREYALALSETISDETGVTPRIGVGCRADTLAGLPASYREAEAALRLHERFHPGETSVALYRQMVVERILAEVPEHEITGLSAAVFNRKNLKLLDEEMLETIDTFLDRDLSLSDTARQLYIHRNTLVYRLDKIQKATGLDLRSFRDAVTFYLLLKLNHHK